MFNLDNKIQVFCMFLSFHDNKNEKCRFPNLFTKWTNKNLGDIKCVEVKRVFCIKHGEKKKTIVKNRKNSAIVTTTVEFVPKKGWDNTLGTNESLSFKTGEGFER